VHAIKEIGKERTVLLSTHNLAEDWLWQGALDEALQLARRGLAIQRGHGEGDDNLDLLLLARVLAARDDREELATMLSLLVVDHLSDADRRVLAVLGCVRDRAGHDAWQVALAGITELPSDLRLELAHLALREGHLEPPLRAELHEVASKHPIWARRVEL